MSRAVVTFLQVLLILGLAIVMLGTGLCGGLLTSIAVTSPPAPNAQLDDRAGLLLFGLGMLGIALAAGFGIWVVIRWMIRPSTRKLEEPARDGTHRAGPPPISEPPTAGAENPYRPPHGQN
jgi:uncharacterized membrane protein